MFIRIFEKNVTGIQDNKEIDLMKNSKNTISHFKFKGEDIEDIETFEESLLIRKIPKSQIDSINILPFYSIVFEDRSVFIFQPLSVCNVLVLHEEEGIAKKDATTLKEGDTILAWDSSVNDYYFLDVEDIMVYDAVEDQYTEDQEDLGFSGYVIGAENPNGLILNNILLIWKKFKKSSQENKKVDHFSWELGWNSI